jgi:hypothetical protein
MVYELGENRYQKEPKKFFNTMNNTGKPNLQFLHDAFDYLELASMN